MRTLRDGGVAPVAVLLGIQLVSGLMPATTALAVKFLVERLAARGETTLPLLAFGALILLGRLAQTALGPAAYLVTQRIDGARRRQLIRLVTAGATADVLERPATRELVRVARADPEFWAERTPGEGATAQLDLLVRWAGVAVSAVVLTSFAWWLAPFVLVPAVAIRSIWRRQFLEHIQLERDGMVTGIEAEHWKRTAIEWTDGKESRTFGFGSWAVDRSRHHALDMLRPRWLAGTRSVLEQWKIAAVVGVPLVIAFALVVWRADGTGGGVASAAAVLGSGWSILNLLGFTDALDIEGAVPGVRAFARLMAELPGADVGTDELLKSGDKHGGRAPLVRFEGVSFTYPGNGQKVLDGLDLEVRPGELLAIVGLNGAGKTTIIKLLTGLYQPTEGRITVDGIHLADTDIDSWRRRISVVFQDFVQYHLPVFDNIALGYGGVPVTSSLVHAAARDTGLDVIVAGLPDGWHTPLARTRPGGVDLSGGQWQKVVLTRAMYALRQGARLLVLDEPTAHLDVRAEFEVFHGLAALKDRAGMVLISHRLSTVRLADRIVLLDGGRIVESGTHAQLMSAEGLYADLFTTQAERFNQGFNDQLDEEEPV
ncbi:ABC transporter ATP-binding protein [Streptomyces silvisoli]|uniref:ABC transporter ATP-binding protein n=1 Tax=Streptomyces silvisoli TaxID=3034235 RepID=A0ABT5ZKE9_9ACTN|nr:ABC transporter ATP-binding protein [Streptomyces silvisoli]MDF3290307.1 ABC transporter ATP-binding protein [Streptomyces silvisoli]